MLDKVLGNVHSVHRYHPCSPQLKNEAESFRHSHRTPPLPRNPQAEEMQRDWNGRETDGVPSPKETVSDSPWPPDEPREGKREKEK